MEDIDTVGRPRLRPQLTSELEMMQRRLSELEQLFASSEQPLMQRTVAWHSWDTLPVSRSERT